MHEIKLYKSKSKALTLLLGCGIFVAIGFWAMDETPFFKWSCIIFFGLGILVALFNLLDFRPQIIINEIGIFDRTNIKEFINWQVIDDAYLININGQKFISLVVDESYRPSKNKSKWYKLAVKINEQIGAQEINIMLGQIEIDSEKFLEFVLKMKDAEPSLKQKLLSTGITHYQ
jgi:hypothetical protein